MKACHESLSACSGGKVRPIYPVLTTYLLEQGSLEELEISASEHDLRSLIQSEGRVTTPLFMNTPPHPTDLPLATFFITVDWDQGTYDVYRISTVSE